MGLQRCSPYHSQTKNPENVGRPICTANVGPNLRGGRRRDEQPAAGNIDAGSSASNERPSSSTMTIPEVPEMNSQYSSTITIPRVPERLRLRENDAYEPRIISFGPYHHGENKLQAMEKYKRQYKQAIHSRKPLEECRNMIEEQKEKIKSYYPEYSATGEELRAGPSKNKTKEIDWVTMMLMDGCFIVEYFLRFSKDTRDELDSIVWAHPLIQYDILLLENQVPFFILDIIFEKAAKLSNQSGTFTDLAIYYFNVTNENRSGNDPIEEGSGFQPNEKIHHLLHLYHSYCLNTPTRGITIDGGDAAKRKEKYCQHSIPNATVLEEAGIRFEVDVRKVESYNLDVTFKKGKITVPLFIANFSTKSKIRNLIAFEQFYPDFDNVFNKNFTAYAEFMDYIVSTEKDVALLHAKRIIRHTFSSDLEIAQLFNHLTKGTFVKQNHYLAPLYEEVNKYMGVKRHKWRASLMHNQFDSPWAILGILSAGILLILTVVQTYFSGVSAF